jgi:N4-gp56 family major capsid protein
MSLTTWSQVQGTVFANPELSKKLRRISERNTKCSALVQPAEDLNLGKKAGEAVALRLAGRITDSATTALGETTPVPFSRVPEYYITATVNRYARAVAWTGNMQDLDRMDVEDKTVQALGEHHARTVNALVYAQLVSGRSFCYRPTGAAAGTFNTDGTSAGAPGAVMTLWHLQNVSRNLMKNNTPYADGSNYLSVISPTLKFNIIQDTAAGGWTDVKKYAPGGVEGVFKNELGSVCNIRFFEDNDILPDGALYGSGFLVGYDAIREVPVYPMHLRYNGNVGGDFGNQQAICWQMLCTWRAIWNFTAHGQGGILHFADT